MTTPDMTTPELIKYIESTQKLFDLPECFELSLDKLKSEETIIVLMSKIMSNTANVCDKFAMLEIIKQWLAMVSHDDIRDCSKCIHKVSTPDGEFSACELWECEFKSKEDKDAR